MITLGSGVRTDYCKHLSRCTDTTSEEYAECNLLLAKPDFDKVANCTPLFLKEMHGFGATLPDCVTDDDNFIAAFEATKLVQKVLASDQCRYMVSPDSFYFSLKKKPI